MDRNFDTPNPPTESARRAISPRFLLGLILALCIGGLVPNVATYFGAPRPSTLAVTGVVLFVAIFGRVILVKTSRPHTSTGSQESDATQDVPDPAASESVPAPSWLILPAMLSLALLLVGLVVLGLVTLSAMSSAPGSVGLLPMIGMGGVAEFLAAHAVATVVLSGIATALGIVGMILVPLDDAFRA